MKFSDEQIFAVDRPDPSLWTYYLFRSLAFGPAFFVALVPLYSRFRTLRYRFDEEGVSMSWGVLFRREINLTYTRIQDIHLSSNAVERWLGLARIEIQTASGSSKAEMTIEGVKEYEALRDFLYAGMRGMSSTVASPIQAQTAVHTSSTGTEKDTIELTEVLRDLATELRALRLAMKAWKDSHQ